MPARALTAAFTLAEGRVTVGGLARTCGVTTSVVGLWMRRDGMVTDPAMISAIQIAFRDAGVLVERAPEEAGDRRLDGWAVWLAD